MALPRLVQLSNWTAALVEHWAVNLRPGVFRKVNWNAPDCDFDGSVRRNGVATMLAGSNNSVVGPVSVLLKPPTTRTLPLGRSAEK